MSLLGPSWRLFELETAARDRGDHVAAEEYRKAKVTMAAWEMEKARGAMNSVAIRSNGTPVSLVKREVLAPRRVSVFRRSARWFLSLFWRRR